MKKSFLLLLVLCNILFAINQQPEASDITLTKKEQQWIQDNPITRIAVMNYWPKIKDGRNLHTEILKLINRNMGTNLVPIEFDAWKFGYDNAVDGKYVHGIMGLSWSKDREENHFFYSPAYNFTPAFLITKKDNKIVKELSDLKHKTVYLKENAITHKMLSKKVPTVNVVDVIDIDTMYKKLASSNEAVAILSYFIDEKKIKDHGLKIVKKIYDRYGEVSIGVNHSYPELNSIINKAFKTIPKEEFVKLRDQMDLSTKNKLKLSKEEKEWLAKKIPIKYVFDPDWGPLEWQNGIEKHVGIVADLLQLIAKRSKIHFIATPSSTWTEATKKIDEKEVQMYSAVGITKKRQKIMNFTKNNLLSTPYVFVTRKNEDYTNGFKGLKDKRIAVNKNSTIHGLLKENKPNIKTIGLSIVDQNGFMKLQKNEIDVYIVNATRAKYHINSLGFNNLKIAYKTNFNLNLKVAITKDIDQISLSIIDKAMDSITEKEINDIFRKWTQVRVTNETDWSFIFKIIGGILFILAFVLYNNKKLKSLVRKKTVEIRRLLKAFDKNVIASKTDPDGIITYVSEAFCEISGFTEAELLGKSQNIVRDPEMPKAVFKDLWKTIRSGKQWRGEVRNKKKNGGFYWVEAIITPEYDKEQNLLGYSAIRQNITSKKEVEDLTVNLEKKVKERTLDLATAKYEIQSLLDNVGQGFMHFDKDMNIGTAYSKETLNILGENIEDKAISNLLFEEKYKAKEFEETVIDIFEEDDKDMQEVLLSLLPTEILLHGKFIELQYKVLNNKQIMLILTNVTSKKELSQKIKEEQQILKMVVETATSMEQFLEITSDYKKLLSKIDTFKTLDMLPSLAREIHTYKGLFAQKEMLNIVNELHNFENYIISSRQEEKIYEEIKKITQEEMFSWLEKDIVILKDILGQDLFKNSNNISINKKRIKKITKKIKKFYNLTKNSLKSTEVSDFKDITNNIKSLYFHNINTFLNPYKKLIEQLSIKLDKHINPLIINSSDIYIEDKFKPFLNSLVHIFRNSVDHGIENFETRYEKGKEQFGTIICDISKDEHNLYINISDDGKGINTKYIKQLAKERNIYTKKELKNLSEQAILKIIFLDDFSTNDIVTDISGRGVGLASILGELEILNGTMIVINKENIGIEFKFTIPM